MAKISEYAVEAVALAAGDLFDISKLISVAPDVYETEKVDWATIVSEVESDFSLANNITGTPDQTLRNNGVAWVANSALLNNGASIGIGSSPDMTYLVNLKEANAGTYSNQLWIRNTNGGTGSTGNTGIAFTSHITAADLGARIYHYWTGAATGDERLTLQVGHAGLVDVFTIAKSSTGQRLSAFGQDVEVNKTVVIKGVGNTTTTYLLYGYNSDGGDAIFIIRNDGSMSLAKGGLDSVETGVFAMGQSGGSVSAYADTAKIYVKDITAGNAAFHITNENGDIIKLYAIGGWGTPTGTFTRTTYATYAGQDISTTPTETEVQNIDDHVRILSERLAALISDLKTGQGFLKA